MTCSASSISIPVQQIRSISSICLASHRIGRSNSSSIHQIKVNQSRTIHNRSKPRESNQQSSVSTPSSQPAHTAIYNPSIDPVTTSIDSDQTVSKDSQNSEAKEGLDEYELHREILSGQQCRESDSALSSLIRSIPKDSFNSTAHSVWQSSSESGVESVEIDSDPDPTPEFDPFEANLNFLQSQQSFSSNAIQQNSLPSRKPIQDLASRAAMSMRGGSRRNFMFSSRSLSNLQSNSSPRDFGGIALPSSRQAHTAASTSRNPDQDFRGPNLSSSPSSSNPDLSFPSHLKNPNPYQIFHLPKQASQKQIKERYFELVRTLHPDKMSSLKQASSVKGKERSLAGGKDLKQVEEEFKVVISAYELLSNSSKRRTYDLSGYGWRDGTSNSSSSWNGKTPRNQDEWRAYQEWSDSLRRSSCRGPGSGFRSGYNYGFRGGHDGFGWQQYANNSQRQEDGSRFYGFNSSSNSSSNQAFTSNGRPQPIYTSNTKFFTSIFILTWTLGYFQYERLNAQSERAIKRADLNHLDAAINLDKAREEARSEEGRLRREAWRKKVRELDNGAGGERLALEDGGFGIGRGGPSGKAAAEERNRKAKLRLED